MFEVLQTEKDKNLIIKDNYCYRQDRANFEKDKVTWRCTVKSCIGRAFTVFRYLLNLTSFTLSREHNHPPDVDEIIKRRKVFEMKEMMKLTNENPRTIVNRVLRGADANVIRAVGRADTLYAMLREYRLRIINPKPYLFETIGLSQDLSLTHGKSLFYQYGPENYRGLPIYEEFTIFYSRDQAINLLKEPIWCVDGTFQVVPDEWYQLYTISYIKNSRVFPSIFIILKDKTQESYEKAFKTVFWLFPCLAPKIIKTDFESAAISALKKTFPDCHVSGCQFHLGQNLMRKLQDLNMYNDYRTDETIKKYSKALMALSYVKSDEVRNTFNSLKEASDFPTRLTPLYNYFFRSYIGNSNDIRFPIKLWSIEPFINCSIPRTNNAIEGWHNTFKNTFGVSIYSFVLLISKLKDEEEAIRQKRIRMDNNEPFKRKKAYIDMEEKLVSYINNSEIRYGSDYVFGLIDKLHY